MNIFEAIKDWLKERKMMKEWEKNMPLMLCCDCNKPVHKSGRPKNDGKHCNCPDRDFYTGKYMHTPMATKLREINKKRVEDRWNK